MITFIVWNAVGLCWVVYNEPVFENFAELTNSGIWFRGVSGVGREARIFHRTFTSKILTKDDPEFQYYLELFEADVML